MIKNLEYFDSYIDEFNNLTFDDKSVCEMDMLIFSQLVYLNADKVLKSDEKVDLQTLSSRFFDVYEESEIESWLSITQKAVYLLRICSTTLRYANVIVSNYTNNISGDIDKQFAGVTFDLNDNLRVVAYRGTDITIAGLKETAMMSYVFPIPAQIEALYYLQETTLAFEGEVYICGHSKGGALASYSATECSNSLKKKIAGVYGFDAPGYPSWFFSRHEFEEIKERIHLYCPQTSIIGRLLSHNEDSQIIESDFKLLKQHQVSSWVYEGNGNLKRFEAFDETSDFISEYVNETIEELGEDTLSIFFETFDEFAQNIGANTLEDIKITDIKKLLKYFESVVMIDSDQKKQCIDVVKKMFTSFYDRLIEEYFPHFKNLIESEE